MDQPYFYFQQRRFEGLVNVPSEFQHFFGHADDLIIESAPKMGSLHQLLNLNLKDPKLNIKMKGLTWLPLIYCFQFEEGFLEYQIMEDSCIRVIKVDEKSFNKDWPYENYPLRFSCFPFSIGSSTDSSLTAFAEDVWQGIPAEEQNKFICIIPPSNRYGVRLWEADSHFDHISIKFFVDIETRIVRVWNECA